jgi:hypothetical protein
MSKTSDEKPELCPQGHPWTRGTDQHGCELRVCLQCTNEKGQQLWDFSGCKEVKEKK